MYPSKKLALALLAVAAHCASTATVSAITISSENSTVLLDSSSGGGNDSFSGTSIPSSQLLDVTRGGYYSRNQIDYTGAGNQVTFLNTFNQKRDGADGRYTDSYQQIDFTVSADVGYSLSGDFHLSDVTTSGYVYFYSRLRDYNGTLLAFSTQVSKATQNENFVIGGAGGDNSNSNFGSLTGTLLAGHTYQFGYEAYSKADGDDGGATATGFVRLDIGGGAPSNAVPDGGTTLALLGLTLTSLAALRRKFTRA